MRPMIMDFSGDTAAINQRFEFMFGKSLLVAPVTDPNVTKWNVYLPKSTDWYDFWTGKRFSGGRNIKTNAALDKIPLFVRSGSIIPLGKVMQYAGEKPADTLEIRIYTGADGQFDLYEDEGDNYNYENGKYSILSFSWNEAKKTVTINDRKGNFNRMLVKRVFNIIVVSDEQSHGIGITEKADKVIRYTGKKIVFKI